MFGDATSVKIITCSAAEAAAISEGTNKIPFRQSALGQASCEEYTMGLFGKSKMTQDQAAEKAGRYLRNIGYSGVAEAHVSDVLVGTRDNGWLVRVRLRSRPGQPRSTYYRLVYRISDHELVHDSEREFDIDHPGQGDWVSSEPGYRTEIFLGS